MSHIPAQARDPYSTTSLASMSARGERSQAVSPLSQTPRRLRSAELMDGEREIEIEHAGAVYRLRRTSLGKLILTK